MSDHASDQFQAAVQAELQHAYEKHGREPWSRHEFYGVVKEELDELWDAIKRDEPTENIIVEARQIACVCQRYAETGDRYRGAHPNIPARLAAVEQKPASPADWRARCVVARKPNGRWDIESPDRAWYLFVEWYGLHDGIRNVGSFTDESSARAALLNAPPYPGAEQEQSSNASQSMAEHPHGVRFLGPEGECLLCKVEVLTQDRDAAQRRYEALTYRHFTCNGCGRSWNCEPTAKDAHGHLQSSLPCPWCNPEPKANPHLKVGDVLPATRENVERLPVGASVDYGWAVLKRVPPDEDGHRFEGIGGPYVGYGEECHKTFRILSLPPPALDPTDVEAVAKAGGMSHAMATAALRAALARGWTRPEKGAGP